MTDSFNSMTMGRSMPIPIVILPIKETKLIENCNESSAILSPFMEIDLDTSFWRYKTEGNANLVLSRCDGTVIRLPKVNKHENCKEKLPHVIDKAVYSYILRYFINSNYVQFNSIVRFTSANREMLNRILEEQRPDKRKAKEISGKFALIERDATLLPRCMNSRNVFAIEIKPKQSWRLQDIYGISCTPDQSSLFDLKGSKRCRYCAMQYSKLKSHKIKELSAYCPMDLFSGVIYRMRKALDALFECPQNNLKIFRAGELYYGEHSESVSYDELKKNINIQFDLEIEAFRDVILNALLKDYTSQSINKINEANSDLPNRCVLRKIHDIQILAKENLNFMSTQTYCPEKTYNSMESLISRYKTSKMIDNKLEMPIKSLPPNEQYLLAATLMDSSIMIAFEKIDPLSSLDNSLNIVTVNNCHFATNVTILDLDPKPDNHFRKYVKITNFAYKDEYEFNMLKDK